VRAALENRGVTLSLEHEAETWGSYFGGLNRGTIYNPLTTASLEVDINKLVGWPDARFFVSAFDIQAQGPSTRTWYSSEKLLPKELATIGDETLTGGTGAAAIYGIIDQMLWQPPGGRRTTALGRS
jgi:hypothetical protein